MILRIVSRLKPNSPAISLKESFLLTARIVAIADLRGALEKVRYLINRAILDVLLIWG
jgi:hypothetical protein